MDMIREILSSTRGRILIGVAVAVIGWKLALVLLAPAKIADGIAPNKAGRVNVRVELTVPVERFHVLSFQQFGRVSGTRETTVDVRSVREADLVTLARPYWVRRVAALPPPGAASR